MTTQAQMTKNLFKNWKNIDRRVKYLRSTPKCPRCDGPDSAIRWKDVKSGILICLSCGKEWKRNSLNSIEDPSTTKQSD